MAKKSPFLQPSISGCTVGNNGIGVKINHTYGKTELASNPVLKLGLMNASDTTARHDNHGEKDF